MMIFFMLLFSTLWIYVESLSLNFMYVYLLAFLALYMYSYLPLGLGMKIMTLSLGLDSISLSLVLLTLWIVVLMILSSDMVWVNKISPKSFLMLTTFLLMSLLISFTSVNMMLFYFFFEVSLIPTLLLIMGWGYQPERTQAGIYFLFYTMTASLPLLLGLFYIYSNMMTLNFLFWSEVEITSSYRYFFLLSVVLAFLVKMPMFLTHLWLPKAHVEAPVAGSMILAGVLLKLGGFGLLRFMGLFYNLMFYFSSLMMSLGLLSMFFVGLICCRIFDLSALIAYSSVAHMALVICGVFTYSWWGSVGCLAMMISHGVSSSGLFCLVNMYYERSHSRSIYLNKGLILTSSIFSLMMFMLCAANISAPPTINLLSEILLMGSIMSFDCLMMLVFPFGSFIGAVYILYMYSYSQHGKDYNLNNMGYNYSNREYFILSFHILPLNFLIIFFYMFL